MSVHEKKEVNPKSKCDFERIKELEKKMCLLRKEIESIKREKVSTENAIERAIFRGVSALGGKYKVLVPEADGLNGSCYCEEMYERDSLSSFSTLRDSQSRKKIPSRVNEKSRLICPEESNTSVCSSNSKSKTKKGEDENCGNYQLG